MIDLVREHRVELFISVCLPIFDDLFPGLAPVAALGSNGASLWPNVDWCEDHRLETLRSNVIGTLTIADICALKGIHHLLYATGCIFEYDNLLKISAHEPHGKKYGVPGRALEIVESTQRAIFLRDLERRII